MTPIAPSPEVLKVAERVAWFVKPEDALKNPITFLAHAMQYGTAADIVTLERAGIGLDHFREVLDDPPVGLFDPRSWAYWNLKCGRPVPPLPQRRFLHEGSAVSRG